MYTDRMHFTVPRNGGYSVTTHSRALSVPVFHPDSRTWGKIDLTRGKYRQGVCSNVWWNFMVLGEVPELVWIYTGQYVCYPLDPYL
jgi:hypothetical protein